MRIKNILLLSIFLFVVFLTAKVALGEEGKNSIDDLQSEIEKLQKKIDDAQGKSKSLSNEIAVMDDKISQTEYRISITNNKISQKIEEINELTGDIEDLEKLIIKMSASITRQSQILSSRLRKSYMDGIKGNYGEPGMKSILTLFDKKLMSTGVRQEESLRALELEDNRLIDWMEDNRARYEAQKKTLAEKKQEEVIVREQLENERATLLAQKSILDDQQSQKQALLKKTQNDEAKYQKLLSDAQRELNSIINAAGAIIGQDGEEVDKGDVIGREGNTGYSFGSHLHFGVYRYSSLSEINGWNWYYSNYVDPAKKLESKNFRWDTGCSSSGNKTVGSGDWNWPMSSPTVTQGYGKTCWSDIYYGGNVHPGFDMDSGHGSPVYAVEDGTAYYCRNCLNDGGNGVFIFHDDNYMTIYWHLQ